jgi:hypothetical protein
MPVKQVFYFSFWYLWSRLSLLSFGLVVFSTTISQLGSGNGIFNLDHLSYIVLIGGCMIMFSMIAVLAHIYYFPVIIDADGISGHGSNSKRCRIGWSELSPVRHIRHVGVPCYSFHSKQDNRRIIVPLCLKRRSEFENALTKQKIIFESKDQKVSLPKTDLVRPGRSAVTTIREGGYIVITTEQRGLKSRS